MKCLISIVCSVLMLLSSAAVSFAQDTSAQEAKKARLEREIAIIDKQLSENASRSNAMLSNLTLIRNVSETEADKPYAGKSGHAHGSLFETCCKCL